MEALKSFYLNNEVFFNMACTLLQIVNIAVILTIYRYFKGSTLKEVKLSCGSFWVRKRHYDVQSVTNIVSLHFYHGGQVPPAVRKEILEKLTPRIKDLKKNENTTPENM